MRIIWNTNPLLTVVELDDADRALLWHRVKIHVLEERIAEAHFDLDPDHQKWCREALKERCPADFVAEARKDLDYPFICGDEKRAGQTFDEYITERTKNYVDELSSAHMGDCVCQPCSCLKCHAESLVGVDTIRGLGKHEASYIGDACGGRSLDQAVAYLRDYQPTKGPEWSKYTNEDFQRYVPRWIGEAKRASEWLEAYRREHFAASGR